MKLDDLLHSKHLQELKLQLEKNLVVCFEKIQHQVESIQEIVLKDSAGKAEERKNDLNEKNSKNINLTKYNDCLKPEENDSLKELKDFINKEKFENKDPEKLKAAIKLYQEEMEFLSSLNEDVEGRVNQLKKEQEAQALIYKQNRQTKLENDKKYYTNLLDQYEEGSSKHGEILGLVSWVEGQIASLEAGEE